MLALDGSPRPAGARAVTASLHFAQGGGRTFLQHQRVPYPFHITRPHALDPERPDLATLILQSASGGLYRGDRLMIDLSAGPRATAHVASQAATVVHRAQQPGIALEQRLTLGAEALLAVTTDPYVLFPDTVLRVRNDVTLDRSATAVLAEGFAAHDPSGGDRPFGALSSRTRVLDPEGVLLVDDASDIDGASFAAPDTPLGPYRALGTVMLLGAAATALDAEIVVDALQELGILSGSFVLPNEAGTAFRLLALEGGRLARGLDLAVSASLAAAVGRSGTPSWRRR